MRDKNEIITVNEQSLKDKIQLIRGQHVMLDSDLAMIYGYETRYLNLQVKHNKNRFPDDFMFQLTREEYHDLMLKNSTSSHGGRRSLPYVFTEQGVYQLATVLKGALAEQQSVAIMRAFRAMREYITQTRHFLPQQELMRLSGKQALLEGEVREIKEKMVTKADLSDFIKLFDSEVESEEILILDGQTFKADLAYQKIIKQANKNIVIVDDYIGSKALQHLAKAKRGVDITIVSDNKKKTLRLAEYNDFVSEYPKVKISLLKSSGRIQDRYIILDYDTKDMKVYHSGASLKDAGRRITTITRITDIAEYRSVAKTLLGNPPLVLK